MKRAYWRGGGRRLRVAWQQQGLPEATALRNTVRDQVSQMRWFNDALTLAITTSVDISRIMSFLLPGIRYRTSVTSLCLTRIRVFVPSSVLGRT